MEDFRFILALIVSAFAAYLAAMNAYAIYASSRDERKGTPQNRSTVPIVSILLAYLAYHLAPGPTKFWVWIAPALDIGNWTVIIGFPWVLIREFLLKKKSASPKRD